MPKGTEVAEGGLAAEMASVMTSAGGGGGLGAALNGLDMSKVSDGFTLVPEDTEVILVVRKSDAKKSGAGNDMVALQLEVEVPEEYAGCKVWDNLVLTPASLWKFKSMAKATGLLSTDGATFIGDSEKDFINKRVGAVLVQDEYNGKKKNVVKGGYTVPKDGVGSDDDAPKFA